jgi:hypothetical protein
MDKTQQLIIANAKPGAANTSPPKDKPKAPSHANGSRIFEVVDLLDMAQFP